MKKKITIVKANMAHFNFDRKFSLIIAPFRAFQAVTDDKEIESTLNCIRESLTDDGIFIVNVFNPRPEMDENWCYPEIIQWERFDERSGNYVVKKHWGDKIDSINQVIYPHFAFEITNNDGIMTRITDSLMLKYYYKEQLQDIIEKAGMSVVKRYAWYDKTPLDELRREIIFVCKRTQ
ncbi:MAG: hypothetical protein ACYCYI_00250 [Saccharofermentanales bacterium]